MYNDNLAVVSDFEEISIQQLLKGDVLFPVDDQDVLGDPVLFKTVDGDKLSGWMVGRFCPVDLMTEPLRFANIKHVFYHRFPPAAYLYVQENISMKETTLVLKSFDPDSVEWDIIYPPVLSFPDQLPTSLDDEVAIDIWIATSADPEDQSNFVKEARPYRAYSYNYVSALLDFSSLPDYDD